VDSKVGLDLHACRSEPIDRHGLGGSALLIHLAGADFLLLRVSRFPLRPFTPQPHEFLVLHSTVSFIPICVTECLERYGDVPRNESHSLVDTVSTARIVASCLSPPGTACKCFLLCQDQPVHGPTPHAVGTSSSTLCKLQRLSEAKELLHW
jgi:hypothetical protein